MFDAIDEKLKFLESQLNLDNILTVILNSNKEWIEDSSENQMNKEDNDINSLNRPLERWEVNDGGEVQLSKEILQK